jgi:hypothetical protein
LLPYALAPVACPPDRTACPLARPAQFAEKIRALINPAATITKLPATKDDPKQRKPDITRAWEVLRWKPRTSVDEGLAKTILYFKHELGCAKAGDEAAPTVWMPTDSIVDRLPRA